VEKFGSLKYSRFRIEESKFQIANNKQITPNKNN